MEQLSRGRADPRRASPPRIVAYGGAVAAVVVAAGLYLLLDPILQPAIFLLLMPAVVFSAWLGGRGPAVAASFASVVAADYLYYAPVGDLSVVALSDLVELVVFLAVALIIGSLMESLQAALSHEAEAHEEARRAVRAREDVLAVVSHDLRNLVGTATTTLEAALDLDLVGTPRGVDLVARATRVLGQGDRLINDLLDVGQAENGTLELRREKADLAAIVEDVVRALEERAGAHQVTLAFASPEAPAEAHVDADRLERVCHNLLSNAIKHSPPGGVVRVSVADGAGAEGGSGAVAHGANGAWVVSVADSGPGIRPEDQAKVFQAFWRGAGGDGVGLGLAISRTLVEAHGGRVWVDSVPGRGSTFRFSIPRGWDAPTD